MANYVSKVNGGSFIDKASWYNVETGTRGVNATINQANYTDTTTSMVYNGNSQDMTGTNLKNCVGILMFCKRLNTTGTVTVALSADSGTTDTVTLQVNASDLPDNPSWVFFKFASPLALDGGVDYAIGEKSDSAGNARFYRFSSTAADFNRIIVWDDSPGSAPVAADNFYICGIQTGTASETACDIIMDQTANTAYGTFDIGNIGSLSFASGAAGNPYLRVAGMFNIWADGILNMGSVATPIPRDSIAILEFNCASESQYYLTVNDGGTFVAQGLSRTAAKNVSWCRLNANKAVNSTSLDVDTDTGWLDNDVIGIAPSGLASEYELGAMNGNAAAGTLTVDGFAGVGGGVAAAKTGADPYECEVILLTRNVIIRVVNATYNSHLAVTATGILDFDWVWIVNMGHSGSTQPAIVTSTTTGSVDVNYCTFQNHKYYAFNMVSAVTTGHIVVSYCVFYSPTNFSESHIKTNHATAQNITVTYNVVIGGGQNSTYAGITLDCANGTNNEVSHNHVSGAGTGFYNQSYPCQLGVAGKFDYNIAHNNFYSGANFYSGWNSGTIDHWKFIRNNPSNNSGYGGLISTNSAWGIDGTSYPNGNQPTVSNAIFLANRQSAIMIAYSAWLKIDTCTVGGDSVYATLYFLQYYGSSAQVLDLDILSCDLGYQTGVYLQFSTNVFYLYGALATSNVGKNIDIRMSNCRFTNTNAQMVAFNTGDFLDRWPTSRDMIKSSKHNQVAGSYVTWTKKGTISTDTTAGLYRTASPSERISPASATVKVPSGIKQVAVAAGATVTPSVFVRESVVGDGTDYNGNRIRLVLLKNPALGITSNTLIDTATVSSEGAFEELTGTTAAAAEDGVFEFYVDCDGTTGWINVDDWTVT